MDNPLLEDVEMSSGSSTKRHRGNIDRVPPVNMILPNSQATVTNLPSAILPMSTSFNSSPDDNTSNSSAIRCVNHERRLDSHGNDGLANTTETVGNASMELLTNDVQASSLSGEETALRVSSDASPLLEAVSPHVQSVLLDKCNVLELSSLAVVSRSLRAGALATMEKRTLNVVFSMAKYRYPLPNPHAVLMRIDDNSDPSRTVTIEFCNCHSKEHSCHPWLKIQKFLYFCGHAFVKHIDFDTYPPQNYAVDSPETMTSVHSSKSELCLDVFFVEKFSSESCECFELLKFVSPRVLELRLRDIILIDRDTSMSDKLDTVVQSRGIRSAESISMDFYFMPLYSAALFDDEQMMMLTASSITLFTDNGDFEVDYFSPVFIPSFICWTPVGVSLFIEQWLRGSREIKRVQSLLSMDGFDSVADFGKGLLEALQRLELPPQVEYSTKLDDDLRGQLQIRDGKMIYEGVLTFRDDSAIIHVTTMDGRRMTIVVSEAWNTEHNTPTESGFIDIFPSI